MNVLLGVLVADTVDDVIQGQHVLSRIAKEMKPKVEKCVQIKTEYWEMLLFTNFTNTVTGMLLTSVSDLVHICTSLQLLCDLLLSALPTFLLTVLLAVLQSRSLP